MFTQHLMMMMSDADDDVHLHSAVNPCYCSMLCSVCTVVFTIGKLFSSIDDRLTGSVCRHGFDQSHPLVLVISFFVLPKILTILTRVNVSFRHREEECEYRSKNQ